MEYVKVTNDNYLQIVSPYIDTFNAAPNFDEWTDETATKKWKRVISNPNYEGYIAYDNDKIVGYIGGVHEMYYMGDTFVIEDFFVINAKQQKGVGTQILNWFEEHLKNNDVIMVRFFTSRIPQQEGYYKKRKYKPWNDIVMMAKEL